jgi:hypothetical protein
MEKKTLLEKLAHFFSKTEVRIRGHLSHYPVLYALIGGVGIVLFWKGVWETAGYFDVLYGPGSILLSIFILIVTGLFVSAFIGDSIIISGLRHEKKIVDKEEHEIFNEEEEIIKIEDKVKEIDTHLEAMIEERPIIVTPEIQTEDVIPKKRRGRPRKTI